MAGVMDALRRFHRADVAWNDRLFGFTPFHPSFWTLRRLRAAVAEGAALADGRLLDAGCGTMPYRRLFEGRVRQYVGLEWTPTSGYRGNRANVCGTLTDIPIRTGAMDTVLCTEVLEHVPEPDRVLSELCRVLRDDGLLILTAPFVYPIHEERDFFRYTARGFEALLERQGFDPVTIRPLGTAPTTIATLTGLYLLDGCFLWNRWLYAFSIPLRPLLLCAVAAINVLGGLAAWIGPRYQLPCNHLVVARRRTSGAGGRAAARPEPALAAS
jgi:SAM-dependent methyltransferase